MEKEKNYKNKLSSRCIEYKDFASSFPLSPMDKASLQTSRKRVIRILVEELGYFFKNVSPSSTKIIPSSERKKPKDCLDTFEGVGGHLHLYLRLHEFLDSSQLSEEELSYFREVALTLGAPDLAKKEFYLSSAQVNLRESDSVAQQQLKEEDLNFSDRNISFCFGLTSYFYHLALFSFKVKDEEASLNSIKLVLKYIELTKKSSLEVLGEVLYGLAGLLFIVLDLHCRIHLKKEWPFQKAAPSLVDAIWSLIQGIFETGTSSEPSRLIFLFHKKAYLGGAHGTFGVYCLLSQAFRFLGPSFAQKPEYSSYLRILASSLDIDVSHQYPSGNFPSSYPVSGSDLLVQFCHGAPGIIPSLINAWRLFDSPKYLEAAKRASGVIEKYGMLLKGWGLCHGISGNAYSFLSLYNGTGNVEYLRLAFGFGLCKRNETVNRKIKEYGFEGRRVVGVSDYPFSLYLGLAGDICFLIDLLQPQKAAFPGYEVPR